MTKKVTHSKGKNLQSAGLIICNYLTNKAYKNLKSIITKWYLKSNKSKLLMEKATFFNTIYYHIHKWNNITIKGINSSQIYTFKNSNRNILGGTKVTLQFVEESQGQRTAQNKVG